MGQEVERAAAGDSTEVVEAEIVTSADIEPFVTADGEILISGEQAFRLRRLLTAVPVDDENGNMRIVDQLLSGTEVADLNRPWEATGGKHLAGQLIRIDAVHQMPSQFAGGVNLFVVAEGESEATHKPVTMTSSALAVIVQLARCCAEGWLPAWCEVVVAERPTDKGYYPYHLRFVPPPMRARS